MFSRTLKMAFWVSYDHLGKLILLNFGCMLLLAPLGALFYAALLVEGNGLFLPGVLLAPLLMLCVFLPLMATGFAWLSKTVIETGEGQLAQFVVGIRRFGKRAIGLGCLLTGAFGLFTGSGLLYMQIFADSFPLVGYSLGALSWWGSALTALIALYAPVALVQKNAGVVATLKLSGMLVVGNPGFTLGLALICMVLLAAAMAPPVLFLFSLAPMWVLLSSAYEILSRYYDAAGAEHADTLLQQPHKVYHDEEDDYLNRGVRDFFYPWKQ